MATGILTNGSVRFNLSGTETEAVGAASRSMTFTSPAGVYSLTVANGTSSSQGNCVFSISGTLSAGTPVDIDLTNLVAAGIDDPLTLTGVTSLLIQEKTSPIGSNYLLVGDSSGTLTNAWVAPWNRTGSQDKISSGGAEALCSPLVMVVDSTHKVLRLNANTGTVSYQIDGIGTR